MVPDTAETTVANGERARAMSRPCMLRWGLHRSQRQTVFILFDSTKQCSRHEILRRRGQRGDARDHIRRQRGQRAKAESLDCRIPRRENGMGLKPLLTV